MYKRLITFLLCTSCIAYSMQDKQPSRLVIELGNLSDHYSASISGLPSTLKKTNSPLIKPLTTLIKAIIRHKKDTYPHYMTIKINKKSNARLIPPLFQPIEDLLLPQPIASKIMYYPVLIPEIPTATPIDHALIHLSHQSSVKPEASNSKKRTIQLVKYNEINAKRQKK